MQDLKDKLIVALDVATLKEAERFVNILSPAVKYFKVGSQLFTAGGPKAVEMIAQKGGQVFLDLKFFDIPRTVLSAVISGTGLACEAVQPAVFMMTVHIQGGAEMLKAAIKGAADKASELNIKRPLIVGVTVLTSERNKGDTLEVVLERARVAKESGLDGVVCSVHEAAAVRKEFGKEFIIITPGIRPKGYSTGDQKRTATVSEAIAAGADFIVVGRPVLEAGEPLQAVHELLG